MNKRTKIILTQLKIQEFQEKYKSKLFKKIMTYLKI